MTESKERRFQIRLYNVHETGGETDTDDVLLFGHLGYHAGRYIIEYDDEDGILAGCKTRIHVTEPNRVTICRTGSMTTEMTMEEGVRHLCHYNTPYGTVMMGIYASEVHSDMSAFGGTLSLTYTLDFNGELVSTNQLRITVKEIF